MACYKILLFNMGYGLGFDGAVKNYVLHSYRYIHCPKTAKQKVLAGIEKLLHEKKPDLCCMIEIECRQVEQFIKEYPYFAVYNKYGSKSKLSKLPVFCRKSMAALSKTKVRVKLHYFKQGTKKLIYEISLPKGITLFTTHFSLSKTTRKKQFLEIAKIIKNKKKIILCGDFNIFGGYGELDSLLAGANLRIIDKNNKTFPACHPKKALDLFLCSKEITAKSRVLKQKLSDHLPVLLELEI